MPGPDPAAIHAALVEAILATRARLIRRLAEAPADVDGAVASVDEAVQMAVDAMTVAVKEALAATGAAL